MGDGPDVDARARIRNQAAVARERRQVRQAAGDISAHVPLLLTRALAAEAVYARTTQRELLERAIRALPNDTPTLVKLVEEARARFGTSDRHHFSVKVDQATLDRVRVLRLLLLADDQPTPIHAIVTASLCSAADAAQWP